MKQLRGATRLLVAVAATTASASAAAQSSSPFPFLAETMRLALSSGSQQPPPSVRGDIELARGKTDLTIFSLRLGETIRLPTCEVRSDVVVNRPCRTGRAPVVHGYFGFPEFPEGDDEVRFDAPPKWARSGDVGATLRGSVPVAVEILADGGAALRQALTAKYGAPARTTPVAFTPSAGSSDTQWTADELEWLLPGLHVQFTLNRYGQVRGEAHGTLRIELDSLRREREGKAAQAGQALIAP